MCFAGCIQNVFFTVGHSKKKKKKDCPSEERCFCITKDFFLRFSQSLDCFQYKAEQNFLTNKKHFKA